MINMGIIQAKAERMTNAELAEYVPPLNLNKEQTDRLRVHVKSTRWLDDNQRNCNK